MRILIYIIVLFSALYVHYYFAFWLHYLAQAKVSGGRVGGRTLMLLIGGSREGGYGVFLLFG